MRNVTINMEKFLAQFNKEYEFLYENCDRVAGYEEAVDMFDEFVQHHKEFVGEFSQYRGDYVASDREAAAFMFALEALTESD